MENFLTLIQPLLFILTYLLFVAWFSSFIILVSRYKYYRLTYNNLVSGKYTFNYECGTTLYFTDGENKYGKEIILFSDGSIKLAGCDNYLHNSIVTFSDPYSTHWFIKLNKWKRKFTLKQLIEKN